LIDVIYAVYSDTVKMVKALPLLHTSLTLKSQFCAKKKNYATEEAARAQQRAVEPLMKE
jgi:hypothetical protein